MTSLIDIPQVSLPTDRHPPLPSTSKPVIIGLYGIPGCGKSYLLNQLKQQLGTELFEFYEGAQVIGSLVPGGLSAFQRLDEGEKSKWRQQAIDFIAGGCISRETAGIVAGHFMFWTEGEETGRTVYTQNDLKRYTHILYLDVDAEVVARRRSNDTQRQRSSASIKHLRKWQEAEKTQLRQLCRDHDILFLLVAPGSQLLNDMPILLRDIQRHTAELNLSLAEKELDEIIADDKRQLHTILVLDADRTLAAEDTGKLFWAAASKHYPSDVVNIAALKTVFSSRLGYSYTAFRQATLLYEESFDDNAFEFLCEEVASNVTLHPELAALLRHVGEHQHIGAVVFTCGLRRIWDKILSKAGLSKRVKVIGGGRLADGLVVTPEVKASLVLRLRTSHKLYVWAFGDSPLDLPMLAQADEAVVVVGAKDSRSKSMDAALPKAVDSGGLRARQALLPKHAVPRLDIDRLPLLDLSEAEGMISTIFDLPRGGPGLRLFHASDRGAARLLATPMRDAAVSGPDLREAHYDAGWYLATEFLSGADVLGVEERTIRHVQGHATTGHRLRHEARTLIVPLMRGGEPMALGVSRALPLARFVHAGRPDDITPDHLKGVRQVILVDSVVNSGATIVEFVRRVRGLRPASRVVVVAGVVQGGCISPPSTPSDSSSSSRQGGGGRGNNGGRGYGDADADADATSAVGGGLIYEYSREAEIEVVALRVSENKYTGRGGTDTGNRLFNTTHLD